jgi:hypothetical protein
MTSKARGVVKTPDPLSTADEQSRAAESYLAEALLCDLHWTMLHVGALAQLTKAFGCSRGEWSLRPWRHLLHDSSATTFLALRFAPQFGMSASLTASLTSFYRRLSKLQADMLPVMGRHAPGPGDETIASLVARWRELTSEGERLLLAFEDRDLRGFSPLYAEDRRMLIAFLRESGMSANSRVDSAGEIALPALKQRRRAARAQVDHACRIAVEGAEHAARFTDLSVDGVGVVCSERLWTGQPLELVIGARRLSAIVVWAEGERYGLRLDTPLRRTDPLFAA